jgi:AraC-like DNA-binding protein
MPIFMDVHIMPGIKALDVAEAHRKDILLQHEHGCKCITYWIDEDRESIFCLIEAPVKEAVVEMHNRAHGSIPHKIIEVSSGVVESFLGRIYDPPEAEISKDGLKVFNDPSFRILLVTKLTDPILLRYKSGAEKTDQLLYQQSSLIRKNIAKYEGSEAEHGGSGFIVSFTSAAKAVSCALAIQKEIVAASLDLPDFRIALNAGVPVGKTSRLFGDTIQFAEYLCAVSKNLQIAVASSVWELVSKDNFLHSNNILTLDNQDECLLELLFNKLEKNFQDPDFDISEYCQAMAMSKSQLYRKTIALTGMSPNQLLKEFRLEKAKELMKKKRDNISEITFDAGFTSPSYFTKCFKKKYGLLPMTYMDLLHQRTPS